MTATNRRAAQQAAFSRAIFDRQDIARLNRAARNGARGQRVLPFAHTMGGHNLITFMIQANLSRTTIERILAEGYRIVFAEILP